MLIGKWLFPMFKMYTMTMAIYSSVLGFDVFYCFWCATGKVITVGVSRGQLYTIKPSLWLRPITEEFSTTEANHSGALYDWGQSQRSSPWLRPITEGLCATEANHIPVSAANETWPSVWWVRLSNQSLFTWPSIQAMSQRASHMLIEMHHPTCLRPS